MKIKHTPGPWIREGTLVYALHVMEPIRYWKGQPEQCNRFSANVSRDVHGGPDQEMEDNAILLHRALTAPHDCDIPGCPGRENKRKLELFDDLLDACKLLVDAIENPDHMRAVIVDQAVVTIAKAEALQSATQEKG